LWQAAVSLTATHSISKISKELVLDYSALKKRVPIKRKSTANTTRAPSFIELNLEPPVTVTECMVEMQNTLGAKMQMHFRGKPDFDLLELAKVFWSKQP
jgi:hypothetical protein